ncbi:hypothetical protein D9Q98_006038 [Chlorella vulgaris]|uniref:Pre-mRNA-splicing factor Syf1/CRNKL1-like C-terminal HAT-repeats domain-containing protein n=1 Tax=Chlorella vulgaris TaxID=3077 RepID=A0A9D4Z0Z0_CHLVU|nr:hypothetical protein D9Q98_006038 [Chlorella vulgaris]
MQPPPKKKRKSEGGQQKRPKAAAASQEDVHPVAQAVQAVVAAEPTGWEELDGQAQDVQQQAEPVQEEAHKKPTKHAKKRAKDDRERQIREAEMRRMVGDAAPSSITEFEQLVLSAPNSSFVWIKYFAFLISLGELDKARTLADRALQTISYREEDEKFNVWVAYLNMENLYGSEDATLALLSRALSHTDARRTYLAAVDIFERSQKGHLVEQCLKAMTRKFNDSVEVWLRAVKFRLTSGDAEGARKTLDRSLQSLPQFEHVRMITQAGLLEFKIGDPERGRSVFEGVLRNHPKRLDLWSVYLDQEVAGGDQQRIRALFERATHLQLPPKKMKFLFKRYLDYEKAHGTAEGVEHVKKRALEYVEAQAGV